MLPASAGLPPAQDTLCTRRVRAWNDGTQLHLVVSVEDDAVRVWLVATNPEWDDAPASGFRYHGALPDPTDASTAGPLVVGMAPDGVVSVDLHPPEGAPRTVVVEDNVWADLLDASGTFPSRVVSRRA